MLLRQLSFPFDLAPTSIGPAVTLFFPASAFGSLDTEKDFHLRIPSYPSFHLSFIKLEVGLPGPHMDEELESSVLPSPYQKEKKNLESSID